MSFNIKLSERKIKMAFDRLIENIVKTQNPSVVGLDPKLDYVPEYIKEKKRYTISAQLSSHRLHTMKCMATRV